MSLGDEFDFDDNSLFLLFEALVEILVDLSTSPSRSGFVTSIRDY
jgi:hypothetical protein